MDSKGNKVSKQFNISVDGTGVVNKSSVSKTDVLCGEKVIITGAVEGGETPCFYTYQVRKPGKTTWTTLGEKLTLTAVAEEGTAPYRYTYEDKKPGQTKFKTIGKRGAKYESVSFTAETAGTYQARVYIQDASDYVTV